MGTHVHAAGLIAPAIAALLAGCMAAVPTADQTGTPQSAETDSAPTSEPTATAIALSEPPESTVTAPDGEIVLTVWLPDDLALGAETPGGAAFQEAIVAFDAQRPDFRVEFLVKRVRGDGGMLAYFRSAPPVAPGILPDLALLDRDALVEASRGGLIVALDGLADQENVNALYPVAREMGAVDGRLVGLPYLLEVDHAVYRKSAYARPPLTFQAVLDSRRLFAIPAGPQGGVSTAVLTQYLAAGGILQDDAGNPALDKAVLTEVLEFYAAAQERGVFEASLFQISEAEVTWAMYHERQTDLAMVTSTAYLAEPETGGGSGLIALPGADGRPYALARGWSWAVVARDADQQAAAVALMNFLMEPVRHGGYTQAAGWLPSQPTALAVWADGGDGYPVFAAALLDAAALMPDTALRSAAGGAIQSALEAVLLGGVSPAQAADDAAAALAESSG